MKDLIEELQSIMDVAEGDVRRSGIWKTFKPKKDMHIRHTWVFSDFSKRELNESIEWINKTADNLNLDYELKVIDKEDWQVQMTCLQSMLLGIKELVESRADCGWRLSKNWKVY